jgi:putative ABC transport system permease protein
MVAAISVGDVIADMLVARQEQMTGRADTYQALIDVAPGSTEQVADDLTSRFDSSSMTHLDGVVVAVRQNMFMSDAIGQSATLTRMPGLTVEWSQGQPLAVRRLPLLSGSYPLPSTSFPPVIAVNQVAAAQIGYPDNDSFMLSSGGVWSKFTVVAVVADGSTYPDGYAALATYLALFGCADPCQLDLRLTVHQVDESVVVRAVHDVVADMSDLQVSVPQDPQRYDTVASVIDETRVLSVVFTCVAVLMLFIAALGIVNVGLSSLRERSKELVIRRAIGATRHNIFALVIGSALMTAAIVAVLSVVLAIAGVYIVAPRLVPTASAIAVPGFPWLPCGGGILAAVITALVGSIIPAIRAARLPVALALRE